MKHLLLFFVIFSFFTTTINCEATNNLINSQIITKPNILWNKSWGSGDNIMTFSIFESSKGDIFISGQRNDKYGFILKYDANGSLISNWTWVNDTYAEIEGITEDGYGNIVALGLTDKNTYILSYNESGHLNWSKRLENDQTFYSIVYANNSFYLGGSFDISYTESEVLVARYTITGTQMWNRTWHGGFLDGLNKITITKDNNTIFGTGVSCAPSYTSPGKVLLLRYTASGNLSWARTWAVTPSVGIGLAVDDYNNTYICGQYNNAFLALKYDGTGNYKWDKQPGFDYGSAVALNTSNDIFMVGNNIYNSVLVKYDSSGVKLWDTQWLNISMTMATAEGVIINNNGEIYVAGQMGISGDHNYVFLLKYKEVEVVTPEFITVLLPTITIMAIFIVVLRKKRNKDEIPR